VAVAAQITLPFPSLLQLASEFTEPTSVVHPCQELPLNWLTIIVDVLLRIAHTTWLVET